jgi:esterase/lipase superfamily enzyme
MKKTLFWAAALLLLAYGAYFVNRNFLGKGPVPTRSGFVGRLPGIEEGDWRRFQFFYATNREDSDETFNGQGSLLGKGLLTGTFDTLISPYMLIKPFAWFDNESMKWGGRKGLEKGPFMGQLKARVQESPLKSVLVIVWGFRDWFQSAALKTAYTGFILDIDTPVVLFDWPGNQGDGARAYLAARRMSDQSAPDLGRFLQMIAQESGAEHIWIMGSSLGCQTISDALVWLSHEQTPLHKFSHVVFSAPDVSAATFDKKFGELIQMFSDHLTAYVSSNDRALLSSHWLNRGRRLGRMADVMEPQNEYDQANELLDLQKEGVRNITVVDATPINRTRNLHHFFTDSGEFFDDLYQRLLQPDDIVSRRLHQIRTVEGTSYWILWNY